MNIFAKLRAYAELIRLQSSTGLWLLFLPCLWTIAMLAEGIMDLIWVPIFFTGAFVMRSAGCIINDLVDQELDKNVQRTKRDLLQVGG